MIGRFSKPGVAVGQAGETIPRWLAWIGAVVLVLISIRPLTRSVKKLFSRKTGAFGCR